MTAVWPFVGRKAQLERIRRDLAGAARGAVVSGAAGVGKTRLLAEAGALAGELRCHLIAAAGTAATRELPFGVFAAHLAQQAGVGYDRIDALLEVAERLAAQAGRQRMLLLVDDANLADQASVALIHHLAKERNALLLLAVRAGEQLPEALHQLWRQGTLDWLELAALPPEEVALLLEQVLGAAVDSRSSLRLAEASEGNPLYLRELVRAGQEQGVLNRESGVWSLSRLPELPTPLADVLRERLAALTPQEREVVALVGSGEPVELELVRRVVGEQLLEKVEAQGLITLLRIDRRAYLRLAHPLYGEILRGEPGQLRLLRLRQDLAKQLVGTGLRRHGDTLRLALSQVDGVLEVDPHIQLDAIRHAAATFDHELVLRLGKAAKQAGGGFDAGHAIAEAYAWKGDGELAEEAFRALEAETASDAQRGITARNRAGNLFFGLGRTRQACQVIEDACAVIQDPHWTGELGLLRAGIAVCSGHAMEAMRLGAMAMAANDEAETDRLQLHQMPGLVSTLTALGNTEMAIMSGEAAVTPLAEAAHEYPYLMATTKVSLSEAYVLHGDFAKADELVTAGYREALYGCADGLRAQWALAAGRLHLATGRLAAAARSLREASLLLGQHGTLLGPPGRIEALGSLAVAHALLGELDAARAALAEAEAVHSEDTFVPVLGLARAWLAGASGDLPAARELALSVADQAQELGGEGYEAWARHTALRLGASNVEGRLAELAAEHAAPLHDAYLAHARAAAADNPYALDQAAEGFKALGATLLSGEVAAAAATVHKRLGHRGNAIASALRAQSRLDDCGVGQSAVRAGLRLGEVPELTPRERETVELAIAGLSNGAIAGRMVLSVRTVESHLYRAYAKLGVAGREELTQLLADLAGPRLV